MQFLKIKKENRQRKDGRDYARALVVKKSRKYGEVLEERHISIRRPVLITGANASGKSYWLTRLRTHAPRIWASRADAEPLYISASSSLAEWVHGSHLELWWAGRGGNRHWAKLKPFEKYEALPMYLKETKAVLFVDDADLLSSKSKKGKVAQDCIRAASVWVIAAQDEGRLFPGLRKDVLALEPQIFRLGTEVAYDYTPQFMWFLMALFMAIGFPSGALAIAGLKMISNGKRAARQS